MSKREEGDMPEEKVRRIAVGATVAGILLILFLLIVLIIQFVQMGVKARERAHLDELIEAQEQQLESGKQDLDGLVNGFRMYKYAFDLGYSE